MKRYIFLIVLCIASSYCMEKEEDKDKKEKKDSYKRKEIYQRKGSVDQLKREAAQERRHMSEPNIEPHIAPARPESWSKGSTKKKGTLKRLSGDFTFLFNKQRDVIKQEDENEKKEEGFRVKMEKASELSPRKKEKMRDEIIKTETSYNSLIKITLALEKANELAYQAKCAVENMEIYFNCKNMQEMVATEDLFFKYRSQARSAFIDVYKAKHPEKAEYRAEGMTDQDDQYKNLLILYETIKKRINEQQEAKLNS